MRTTIELTDDQRDELLRLAAMNGDKDFSAIIEKAVQQYIDQHRSHNQTLTETLKLKGSFTGQDADEFQATVTAIRKNWR